MTDTLYYVGFCSRCGTGPLGIRICGGCQRAWIVCDECDAVWADPSCDGEPLALPETALPCPECHTSLQQVPARWATRDDLVRIGWQGKVVGQGKPFGADSGHDRNAAGDAEI